MSEQTNKKILREALGPGPEVSASPRRFGYHPSLDGVRGIFMLWILGYHYGFRLFGSAQYGLDVFFVLSGFLITTLLLQEFEGTQRISLRLFYGRRAARLLPALFVACGLVAAVSAVNAVISVDPVLYPATAKTTIVSLGMALGYLSAWASALSNIHLAALAHTWSLSVEEWFYALWPPLLVLLLRRRRWRTTVVGAALAAMVYRLVSEHVISSDAYLYFAPDQRACQLLAGCALGVIWVEHGSRIARHARALTYLGLAGALAVVAIVGRPLPVGHGVPRYDAGLAVPLTLATVAALALIVVRPQCLLARALATRPLVWVGRRSYGLYLYHYAVIFLVWPRRPDQHWRTAVSLAVIFAMAAVSYRWVEQPAIRWMRAREKRARETRHPRQAPHSQPVAVRAT